MMTNEVLDPMRDRLEQAEKSLGAFKGFLASIMPTYNYDRNMKAMGQQIERVLRNQHGILVVLEHELAELREKIRD